MPAARAATGSKVKCPDWKRDNAERFRMFQGQSKPLPSERERALKKKREELSRVRERVQKRSGSMRPFWSRKSLNQSRPDPAHQLVRQAVNHIVGLQHPAGLAEVWPPHAAAQLRPRAGRQGRRFPRAAGTSWAPSGLRVSGRESPRCRARGPRRTLRVRRSRSFELTSSSAVPSDCGALFLPSSIGKADAINMRADAPPAANALSRSCRTRFCC